MPTRKQKEPAAFKRWRNFLKKHGGKGYTREELSRMYRKKYPKKKRTRKTAKKSTRRTTRKTTRRTRRRTRRVRGRGYDTDECTTESE